MEKNGLSINIAEAASRIARGRRSLEIKGETETAILIYENMIQYRHGRGSV
jgi:hypothetical protein